MINIIDVCFIQLKVSIAYQMNSMVSKCNELNGSVFNLMEVYLMFLTCITFYRSVPDCIEMLKGFSKCI